MQNGTKFNINTINGEQQKQNLGVLNTVSLEFCVLSWPFGMNLTAQPDMVPNVIEEMLDNSILKRGGVVELILRV